MYVYIYIYIYIHTHIVMCTLHMYICVHVCVYIYIYIGNFIRIQLRRGRVSDSTLRIGIEHVAGAKMTPVLREARLFIFEPRRFGAFQPRRVRGHFLKPCQIQSLSGYLFVICY